MIFTLYLIIITISFPQKLNPCNYRRAYVDDEINLKIIKAYPLRLFLQIISKISPNYENKKYRLVFNSIINFYYLMAIFYHSNSKYIKFLSESFPFVSLKSYLNYYSNLIIIEYSMI